MKKRYLMPLTLLLLCLIPAALALTAEGDYVAIPEEGVKVFLKDSAEWTIVTADNLDEHIDLILSRGETEENARMRYAEGSVVFEAFHEHFPDGRIRLEAFENAGTRNVWHLDDLSLGKLDALTKSMKEDLFCGRYRMLRVSAYRSRKVRRDIIGSMITNPPYQYESGMYSLCYYNGKAYMYSYAQSTIASAARHLNPTELMDDITTYAHVGFEGSFGWAGFFVIGERLTPVADLSHDDERLILNAHSGTYKMMGGTEKLASVFVSLDGVETKAKVDDEAKYACEVTLTPGDNKIVSYADKKDMRQNSLTRVIPVDDGKAALELTDVPFGYVDRSKIIVSGITTPGASVQLRIDGGDIIEAEVDQKGKFKEKLTAADWEEHTLTVTVHEEGLEDLIAEYPFCPEYADAQKGIYAFNKVRDKEILGLEIVKDPAAYIDKKVLVIAKVTEVTYGDGLMTMLAQVERGNGYWGGESYNGGAIYFVSDSYLDDVVSVGSVINVYGVVLEPSMTEPPVARMSVEYVSYYK